MPAETRDINVTVQELDACTRKLSVNVPAERVRRTRGKIASQIATRVKLPGFRQGKMPTRLIEQKYGPSIDQETIDRLIQEAYREAINEQGLVPLSQGKVENVEYDPEGELRFDAEFEVRPEVEIARDSGFTASRPPEEVGEEDVDSVLERLREERGEWEPLTEGKVDYGDQVLVQITALDEEGATQEGEEPRSYRFVLGEGQAIPAVEESIMTLQPGGAGDFTVEFPEDFPDEERRGEKQHLHIEVTEAQRKRLPELTDELAQQLGDFETMDALRERILEDLREDARQRADAEVRRQFVDQIIEANEIPVPGSMVERYLDHMTGHSHAHGEEHEHTPEEMEQISRMREGLRPQAEWGIKRMLIVETLAEREGLQATQDEIDARVEALAEQHGRSASEVWIQLEKSGQLETLEREITENKVFDYLQSQNTVA